METYKKPDSIPSNMGGANEVLDERMLNILELLDQAPLDNLNTFLDIGIGKGQLAIHLAKKGKKVIGTGLELESYGLQLEKLKKEHQIECIGCDIESMPFANQSFDGIVMSHILEHCPNIAKALKEVRRILKDTGWLFIFVPPHETRVCAGHISIGWNIGQLMYILLLNGFDIKNGRFIKYGYNIAGFVQKNHNPLPPLRGDQGDIHILNKNGLFPAQIITVDGYNDGYFGDLISINWDKNFVDKMIEKNAKKVVTKASFFTRLVAKIINILIKPLPKKSRIKLSQKILTLANVIYGNEDKNSGAINPSILNG